MSEAIGWVIVLALALTIACIFMLSSQLEQHARRTTEMMYRNNELLLGQLERLSHPSGGAAETPIGVVLDRRIVQRRDPLINPQWPVAECRELPRRRMDDLLSA